MEPGWRSEITLGKPTAGCLRERERLQKVNAWLEALEVRLEPLKFRWEKAFEEVETVLAD